MAKNAGRKREAAQASIDSEEGSRRTKSKADGDEVETVNKPVTRSSDQSSPSSPPAKKKSTKENQSNIAAPIPKKKKIIKKGIAQKVVSPRKTVHPKVTKNSTRTSSNVKPTVKEDRRHSDSFSEVAIPVRSKGKVVAEDEASENDDADGPSYWLMKAEPESRIEKGKDVKFSIDDLEDATEPEAWDGVRNAAARNNMRAMLTGDMAFFYHSNCKKPGIAGTMEVVREHSVDETAFDPENPYFDPKSTREKPKWCVVHVEFRRKFPELVTLKEMQRYAKPGGVLESMSTLKMSRLSVSRVTKREWDFIHSLVDTDGESPATTD